MMTAIRGFLRSLTVTERLQIISMYSIILVATLLGIAASVLVGRFRSFLVDSASWHMFSV